MLTCVRHARGGELSAWGTVNITFFHRAWLQVPAYLHLHLCVTHGVYGAAVYADLSFIYICDRECTWYAVYLHLYLYLYLSRICICICIKRNQWEAF